MAITTLDGIIAGAKPPEPFIKVGSTMEAAGVMCSKLYDAGRPGASSAPSPGLGGAALTSYSGQIPFTNPSSGNTYLTRFGGSASVSGTLILADRLWHNSGFTVTTTTAQTVNSVAWPARDRNGSTNGDGVLIGIEVSTATTNGSAVTNMTMSYTDSDGNSGATAAMPSFPASAALGTFVPFTLAAGDVGVRSVQSLTLGTSLVTGAVHLVAYRELARVELPVANVGGYVDALTGGFPELFDDTVPFLLWLPTATTAVNIAGTMHVAQG